MKARLWTACLLLLTLTALPAFAKDREAKEEPAAPSMEDMMKLPEPGPELKTLDYFAGTWTTATEFLPSEWMPKGGKSTGTITYKWTLNRMFLKGHYEADSAPNEPEFKGLGIMGWDMEKKAYMNWWFDVFGMGCVSEGQWAEPDKTLVLQAHYTYMGKPRHERWTFMIVSKDQFDFAIDAQDAKGDWKTEMKGTYTRSAEEKKMKK